MNEAQQNRGFTLIEVLVSVSIFAIVMLVTTGSVFTIVAANKKTHTLKSVMTNLNFALESMARDVRVGTKYFCSGGMADGSGNCANGGTTFRYKANRDVDGGGWSSSDSNDQIEYSLSNGRLMKALYGQTAYPITATEISVTSLQFYATGVATGDGYQPKVIVSIQGFSGTSTTKSTFNIQTTISERSIDS